MIVHSYTRFSDPSQADGDSQRRQDDAAAEYCNRKGWTLSNLRFNDHGKSGFKGDKQRALNAFLKLVEEGRVNGGETLLVENLDRLSRKGIRATQNLINKLFDAGINIATLFPIEKLYKAEDSANDIGASIELASFAYSAHTYSKNLSTRVKAFNTNRREQVRQGKATTLSTQLPSWLELVDGKQKPIPAAVKAIKYIFRRTIDGVGRKSLCAELNGKFPPLSKRKNTSSWNETMVANLIKSRRVLGDAESTVTGEIFKGIYPQVIDEQTWKKANAASARRRSERGKPTEKVNLFNGLLWHAVDGCKMGFHAYQARRVNGDIVKYRRYRSYNRELGLPGADTISVDVDKFEDLVFNFLPTIKLDGPTDDPRGSLIAQQDYLSSEIKTMQDQIRSQEQSAKVLAPLLGDLSMQLDAVEKDLKSTAGAFTVKPTLKRRCELLSMRRGTIEERKQVRNAVRDIVERIDCLPIKMGTKRSDRVRCLVEIKFRTGEFVRGIELDDGILVKISGKQKTPLAEQCKSGFRLTLKDYRRLHDLVNK